MELCWLIAGIQGIGVSLGREQFAAAREMLSLHVQDTRTSTSRAPGPADAYKLVVKKPAL